MFLNVITTVYKQKAYQSDIHTSIIETGHSQSIMQNNFTLNFLASETKYTVTTNSIGIWAFFFKPHKIFLNLHIILTWNKLMVYNCILKVHVYLFSTLSDIMNVICVHSLITSSCHKFLLLLYINGISHIHIGMSFHITWIILLTHCPQRYIYPKYEN